MSRVSKVLHSPPIQAYNLVTSDLEDKLSAPPNHTSGEQEHDVQSENSHSIREQRKEQPPACGSLKFLDLTNAGLCRTTSSAILSLHI